MLTVNQSYYDGRLQEVPKSHTRTFALQ